MKISQAYITFTQLVNKNLTNDNISVDKPRFIYLFNRVSIAYVEWLLEKSNEDDVRDIQSLLVLDKNLTLKNTKENHTNFNLPTDYLNLSNLQVFGTKSNCKNVKIATFEVKNQDVEELIQDEFNKPSFEFRETFYTVASNNISVYKTDFKITKSLLSYYRYPIEVDIKGYINSNGGASIDIDPEFDDKVVNKILLACTKDVSIINSDLKKYNLDKDRLFSEI